MSFYGTGSNKGYDAPDMLEIEKVKIIFETKLYDFNPRFRCSVAIYVFSSISFYTNYHNSMVFDGFKMFNAFFLGVARCIEKFSKNHDSELLNQALLSFTGKLITL